MKPAASFNEETFLRFSILMLERSLPIATAIPPAAIPPTFSTVIPSFVPEIRTPSASTGRKLAAPTIVESNRPTAFAVAAYPINPPAYPCSALTNLTFPAVHWAEFPA